MMTLAGWWPQMDRSTAHPPHGDMAEEEFEPPLDAGIAGAVMLLRSSGVETFESCEGGPEHSYPEPTIRFEGGLADGPGALSVAMMYGLPVSELRRVWRMQDGEPTGPVWELTFYEHAPVSSCIERIFADRPGRSAGSSVQCCSRHGTLSRHGTRRFWRSAKVSSS